MSITHEKGMVLAIVLLLMMFISLMFFSLIESELAHAQSSRQIIHKKKVFSQASSTLSMITQKITQHNIPRCVVSLSGAEVLMKSNSWWLSSNVCQVNNVDYHISYAIALLTSYACSHSKQNDCELSIYRAFVHVTTKQNELATILQSTITSCSERSHACGKIDQLGQVSWRQLK